MALASADRAPAQAVIGYAATGSRATAATSMAAWTPPPESALRRAMTVRPAERNRESATTARSITHSTTTQTTP